MNYLYTSCFGCFVFDEKFELVDKAFFEDVTGINSKLKSSEWIEEERKLIKKHGRLMFIGFKKEKIEGITCTQDPAKLGRIAEYFKKDFSKFFDSNLAITKKSIKSSVTKDLLIAQAVNSIDELNKTINLNVKRLREWYSLYNPEFSSELADNEKFVELIAGSRDAKEKGSMGAEFEKKDYEPIKKLAEELKKLYELKSLQTKYIEEIMAKECPNITAVAGALIGAKLIELSGSLKHMAEIPASTIQLLGAEKALFRHLRNKKALAPKHGIIHEHPLISQSPKKEHGKIARTLADKISIAAKVDYFKGQFIGDELRKKLEEKFK